MKKIIVGFVASLSLIASVLTVSAQTVKKLSNTEIANLVAESCKKAGTANPDELAIGETFPIYFNSGKVKLIVAWDGATRWGIADSIGGMQDDDAVIGIGTPYDTVEQAEPSDSAIEAIAWQKAVDERKIPMKDDKSFAGIPNWLWAILSMLAIVILFGLIFYYFNSAYSKKEAERKEAESRRRVAEEEERRRQNDPVLAGPPMYPGGVNQDNALSVMTDNAHRNFPRHNVRIALIEHGSLDSHGVQKEVGYGDHPRLMVLRNTPGIRATVFLDDAIEPVYAFSILQCGNDIRAGYGIPADGITFTLTPNVEPIYVAPVRQIETRNEQATVTAGGSQIAAVVAGLPALVDKALQEGVALKLNINIDADGSQDMELNFYAPSQKKG
ncbi:MAG: hypothetical protein KBC17_01500 [Candidatus Pacebacteria bacterium]|nr:hypothetical protein [Candidatus Paceibacterota bacterium]